MNVRRAVVGWSLAVGLFGCGGASAEGPKAAPSASAGPANDGGSSATAQAASSPSAPSGSEGSGAAPSALEVAPAPITDAAADKPSSGKTTKESTARAGVSVKEPTATKAAKPTKTPVAPSGEQAPGAGAAHSFDCGDKGQKPCPLQGWMKTNMAPAAASGDAALLGKQFDHVASHAPPGLGNWASIAKTGAGKAKSGDLDGAKDACKTCHDQYKAKYKVELRDRPF